MLLKIILTVDIIMKNNANEKLKGTKEYKTFLTFFYYTPGLRILDQKQKGCSCITHDALIPNKLVNTKIFRW